MGTFEYISTIAVFCYLLLFLIFMAAKKNQIIRSYLLALASSILWTGGSALMRARAWPSYGVWYDVSVCGLLFLVCSMFLFVNAFSGQKRNRECGIWLTLTVLACVINTTTGFFLEQPRILWSQDGKAIFEYHMTWRVSLLFLLTGGILLHMLYILISNCRNNRVFRKQIEPTIIGMVLMFASNLALLIPQLKGFPIDILGGLLNALLMFYGLIKRRLFRLKFLASEGICYAMALILALLMFYNLSPGFLSVLRKRFAYMEQNYMLIFASLFLVVALLFVYLWKRIISSVFVKEEIMQKEYLQRFSRNVAKSLRIKDIYEEIVTVILEATEVQSVYICMPGSREQNFYPVYADKELKRNDWFLRADHPLVRVLQKKENYVVLKDFALSTEYKAMWKEEINLLNRLDAKYALALKEDRDLLGILLLSDRENKSILDLRDNSFLSAVSSIASMAIKNSMLYERTYQEAVTDELTGLLNRRYFRERVQQSMKECRESSLVLMLVNVDDFKLYNQLYGNMEGDQALKSIAAILKASVGENGWVGRYSGKEFGVLLPQYDILAAKTMAESIRDQIYNMNGNRREYSIKHLTISVGISSYPFGSQNMAELFENVDMAVYAVKRSGKNAIRIFDQVVGESGAEIDNKAFNPQNVYMEYESTIYALTAAIDTKDHYTFSHSNNVAYYATKLANALGLNDDTVEIIRQAALLHDVGKIGIPENILNKPGKLTDEEYEIIKGHVEASIGIIRHLPSLDYVIPAVIGHHERYDGYGYPRGLAGEEIPTTARILCIADSFDAIVSRRVYKKPIPLERAIEIMNEESGKQFDPDYAAVFISLLTSGKVRIAASEEVLGSQH